MALLDPCRFRSSALSIDSRASSMYLSASCPTTPESEYDFNPELLEEDKYILVTGGLGYIGSHTTLELLRAGHNVVVIDDLSNSHETVLDRLNQLVSQHYAKLNRKAIPTLSFHKIDYRDTVSLRAVLDQYVIGPWSSDPDHRTAGRSKIIGVIHFAAFKAVAESILIPLSYYSNNVGGFIGLLETLGEYGIKTLAFSSSATVYGAVEQDSSNIPEEFCVHTEEKFYKDAKVVRVQQGCRGLTNPYGRTKWMCEAILWDLCISDPEWRIVALRYFNPIGCDPSGLLGEDPLGIPNNLMPVVCKVLRKEIPTLNVFGSDYDTPDGTGVRDYIHVTDLAKGHLAAMRAATEGDLLSPFRTFNLGSGQGHSVLELVNTMKKVSGKDIPLQFTERRAGDVASCVARPSRAERELRWKTERRLIDSCQDTWNFLLKNPQGYRSSLNLK
jgi:UDP-glucose 4-epimerase